MSSLFKWIFGPRLLQYEGALPYEALALERWGETALSALQCARTVAVYTSPLVLPWGIRRGWLTVEGGLLISKFLAGVGLVVGVAIIMRTVGRATNPAYRKFISVLSQATDNYTAANKKLMEKYDFQFSAWPVDFDIRNSSPRSESRKYLSSATEHYSVSNSMLNLVSWLLTHSFGLSLVYPGSMSLMQMMVEKPLLEGRTKLVQEYGGVRNKVITEEGNQIDTIVVDRKNQGPNGDTLVICCEGNAGFYEIGMMMTPVKCGYSVLGWNHPGFYGSTGRPTPSQEANAVDAVMQFAIQKLGYLPSQIVVYGWSIGGYTATWLAMNYPEVKGLVLDATFDHLTPLAVPRMPAFMSEVVRRAVRDHINLGVLEQAVSYPGPIRLIRRSRDEMITTQEGELWSNRGNNLLKGLLSARYPSLMTASSTDSLDSLLYRHGAIKSAGAQLEARAVPLLSQHTKNPESLTEEERGLLLAYLASKMLTEVDTTHCTPLPTARFQLPWDQAADLQDSDDDIEVLSAPEQE